MTLFPMPAYSLLILVRYVDPRTFTTLLSPFCPHLLLLFLVLVSYIYLSSVLSLRKSQFELFEAVHARIFAKPETKPSFINSRIAFTLDTKIAFAFGSH